MITLATKDDLQYLAEVELSAAKKFQEYRGSVSSLDKHILPHEVLETACQEGNLWVARDENRPIAFLAALKVDKNLHIEEVSVAFEHQGKGIGRQLMAVAICEAGRRLYQAVSLTTDREIPWNYLFYQRLGFEEIDIGDCSPMLADILLRDKNNNPIPDKRIAMIHYLVAS